MPCYLRTTHITFILGCGIKLTVDVDESMMITDGDKVAVGGAIGGLLDAGQC